MKKLILSAILFCLPILSANAYFDDVDSSHPHYKAINWLEHNNVVEGYADYTFKPDNPVNRAEFLKMLFETLGPEGEIPMDAILETSSIGHYFPDVQDWDWYASYVHDAVLLKIVEGYPDGTFKPANNINYAEALKIVANAFFDVDELYGTGENYTYCYEDLSSGITDEWFWKYVYVTDKYCVYPHDTLNPSANITRGQMAELLYRAKAVHDNDLIKFNDNLEPDRLIAENMFNNRVRLGEKIGEWTINDIGSLTDHRVWMNFSGNVTLSGEYYYDGYLLKMDLDEESLAKMPIYYQVENETNTISLDTFPAIQYPDEFSPKGESGQITLKTNFYDYKYTGGDVSSYKGIRMSELIEKTPNPYPDPELCAAEPKMLENGKMEYPIHEKYYYLYYLGQLFTEYDCGGERLNEITGVEDDMYDFDISLELWHHADEKKEELISLLGNMNAVCTQDGGETCHYWDIKEPVPLEDILKLKDYYELLFYDDCIDCGMLNPIY